MNIFGYSSGVAPAHNLISFVKYIPKFFNVVVKENVGIEVNYFISDLGHEVGNQAQRNEVVVVPVGIVHAGQ